MRKELLFSITKKDLKITWFSGTGSGGQHRNKHQNCVRLQHIESGIIATGQSNKDRINNMKEAFYNLTHNIKFKIWCNIKGQEIMSGKSIEETVEELMSQENLKIEIQKEGKWVKEYI